MSLKTKNECQAGVLPISDDILIFSEKFVLVSSLTVKNLFSCNNEPTKFVFLAYFDVLNSNFVLTLRIF